LELLGDWEVLGAAGSCCGGWEFLGAVGSCCCGWGGCCVGCWLLWAAALGKPQVGWKECGMVVNFGDALNSSVHTVLGARCVGKPRALAAAELIKQVWCGVKACTWLAGCFTGNVVMMGHCNS
jgi:hypothetical protein